MHELDFMADIETVGLDSKENPITSVALVPFRIDYHSRKVEALDMTPLNFAFSTWPDELEESQETLKYRAEKGIDSGEEDLSKVSWQGGLELINGYLDCLLSQTGKPKFWSWHTNFDLEFLKNYYKLRNLGPEPYAITFPFSHREIWDVPSWCKAMIRGDSETLLRDSVPFTGQRHNALADCHHQIHLMNAAMSWKDLLLPSFGIEKPYENPNKLSD